MEYFVTQKGGSEYPVIGKYVDFFEDGKYNCIVCNENVFDSENKLDTIYGWAAFNKGNKQNIQFIKGRESRKFQVVEYVLCKNCGASLGHTMKCQVSIDKKKYFIHSPAVVFEPR